MTIYCHPCSVVLGLSGTGLPSNLTASQYQVDKFVKHTLPAVSAHETGVFSDPSYTAYANYLISSSLSGSVEVDGSGRTNRVWYAGGTIGASWVNGQPVLPNDAVKLVLEHDASKIHGYSITSATYSGQTCVRCGGPVL